MPFGMEAANKRHAERRARALEKLAKGEKLGFAERSLVKDEIDAAKEKVAAADPAFQDRQDAIADGAWWLKPDIFRAFGIAQHLVIAKCDYLGGLSSHPKGHHGNYLWITAAGLQYKGITTILQIPWGDVARLSVEGTDQVNRRVTASRVAMVGVFAWAVKKTAKSAVLIVDLNSGEQVGFQTHAFIATDLRAKLLPILSHYREEARAPGASAADEIRKLAQLRDDGILNEQEFQAKKADLLARM
ncbi:MAG: SHOCT domain-containing protein [Candidatus Dormiibacterota bacterium]